MRWLYDETVQFHMWDKTHLVTIALLGFFLLSLYILRERIKSYRNLIRISIGVVLILSRISLDIWYVRTGNWDIRSSLPLELCSIASLTCAIMLLTKNRFLFEIVYFIGIAGAIQAIVTPELIFGFPQYRYIQFFTDHFLLITGPLLMIWLYEYTISTRALVRAFITINAIAVLVFTINLGLNANYMFLIHKPASASLLDVLGPYPFYLIVLEVIVLCCFSLLLLPFILRNRKHIRQ